MKAEKTTKKKKSRTQVNLSSQGKLWPAFTRPWSQIKLSMLYPIINKLTKGYIEAIWK